MTRVLLVEDDPMARQLLEIYISNSDIYELAGSVESALFAEAFCRTHPVDMVLMDVCTAMNANGIDAARKIKKNMPHIKVIIITSQPECSFIDRAREAQVDSFWYKESTAEKVIEVMDRTMNGESVYPDTTPTLQLGSAKSSEFSAKELEVLRELISGESDAVIADKLHMSLRTVKAHIQTMREKTGFRNRTELAVRARECGLVINEYKDE